MRLNPNGSISSLARGAGAFGAAALLVAGCVTAGTQAGASGSLQPSPSAGPSGSFSTDGFYLRAWQTQALASQYTFTWLPVVTISSGQLIDGMVAVPAIYPGPLWVGPSVRSISAAGIASIVAEARTDGLLGTKHDFTDNALAGSVTAHVQMVVDGVTYDLTGPASSVDGVSATPGTAAAFAAFWQKLTGTTAWLGNALGQESPYVPVQLAVLAMPPTEAASGITPGETAWPLAMAFASFGTPLGAADHRCGVVSGADLALLLPVVKQSNQLTRFVDSGGVKDSLLVRVLVPGEPSPCV